MASIRKASLDFRVATVLGLPINDVRTVTATFLEEARDALAEDGEIYMDGFGRLRVIVNDTFFTPHGRPACAVRKHHIGFTKCDALDKALRAHSKEAPYGKVRRRRVIPRPRKEGE